MCEVLLYKISEAWEERRLLRGVDGEMKQQMRSSNEA
jgi:hypothetical protein